MEEAKDKLVNHLTIHNDFLKNIGMVTNVAKTELVFFQRPRSAVKCPDSVIVNKEVIIPKDSIKVLGVTFDKDLSWKTHFENLTKKAKYTLAKMKFLSKYLYQSSMKKVITSHYFSTIYYGSPVWLGETTSSKHVSFCEKSKQTSGYLHNSFERASLGGL